MGALGDRMKEYERDYRTRISRTLPIILRLDGKAFHTYTRGCEKPFDLQLMKAMDNVVHAGLEKELGKKRLVEIANEEQEEFEEMT